MAQFPIKNALIQGALDGTPSGGTVDLSALTLTVPIASLRIGTSVQAYDADLTTWAGVTPAAGITTFLTTPTSANLLASVTNETGTGSLVFSTSPTLITPSLGTPSSLTLTNATGLPAAGVTGTAVVIGANTSLTSITGLTGNVITTAGNFQTTTGLARFGTASATTPRLHVKDNGMAGNSTMEVHSDDGSPWGAGFFNDTYSTTTAGLLFYINNSGVGFFGSEGATSWSMFTNGGAGVSAPHMTITHGGGVSIIKTLTSGANGTSISRIRHGVSAAMTAGVVAVTDANTTANTRFFFSTHSRGTITLPASYDAATRSAGTSFTITSSMVTDTSTVAWIAIEP